MKDIPGYEKLYAIRTNGEIYSYRTCMMLSLTKDTAGYLKVALYKNKVRKDCLVHRLVAITYLKNKNKLKQVNHKDLNKQNNKVENLEWVTNRQNRIHFVKNNPLFGILKIYKKLNRYQAFICKNGSVKYLGSFVSKSEAMESQSKVR